MTEARRRDLWDHTSSLIAAIANTVPGRKKPVHPHEVNPFTAAESAKPDRIQTGIQILKLFLPKHKRGRITIHE